MIKTQLNIRLLLLITILIIINVNMVNSLREGDIVRMSKKSIHDLKSTDWTDIKAKFSPRFKIDKTITLSSLTSVELTKDSLYKISFSFFDKFATTWITVADGNGVFLNNIEFTFTYSNNEIIDVKYHLDYNDEQEHMGKKPEHFYLIYKWEQVNEQDIPLGLFVLFFIGILMSGVIFTYDALLYHLDSLKSKTKRLPSFNSPPSKSSTLNNTNQIPKYNNQNNNDFHDTGFYNNNQNYNNKSNDIYQQGSNTHKPLNYLHSSGSGSPAFINRSPQLVSFETPNSDRTNSTSLESTLELIPDDEIESFVPISHPSSSSPPSSNAYKKQD